MHPTDQLNYSNQEAAVAAIVVLSPRARILVLKRKHHPSDPWSGHYAFPGGRREPEDASLYHTCLRETREECGILLSDEDLVKRYPVRQAGNHLNRPLPVTPYLFEMQTQPNISLQWAEIRCYEWLDLDFIAQQENIIHKAMSAARPELLFPCIPASDGLVWGFTFEVLMLLLADRYQAAILG